jgi:hypothetical protein
MYEIKTTKDAFNRLGFTLSKGNKPNNTDLEAFNFLVETFNKTIEKTTQENRLFAKLYILTLKDYTAKYNDIEFAKKEVNKYLASISVLNACEQLFIQLRYMELNNYFEALNIKETCFNGQSVNELKENILQNKETFKNVDVKEFLEVFDTWDIDNVISLVNTTITLAIHNYKNLD